MTRSRRKIPIVKGPKVKRNWYNRRVKRHQRQQTRDILTLKDILDYEISSIREIVNDYDVCDWVFDYEHRPLRYPRYHNQYNYSVEDAKRDREENIKKYSRK